MGIIAKRGIVETELLSAVKQTVDLYCRETGDTYPVIAQRLDLSASMLSGMLNGTEHLRFDRFVKILLICGFNTFGRALADVGDSIWTVMPTLKATRGQISEVFKRVGSLGVKYEQAVEDTKWTKDEKASVRAEIHEAIQALVDLDVRIANTPDSDSGNVQPMKEAM